MVSEPSGLLTCLERFSALRTSLRVIGAWALGMGLLFIALQNAVASARTILVFGDSLSAAYGIRPEQGWVALLAQRLQTQGYGYQVVNASVSGETSTGGLERLPRALQLHTPGHRDPGARRQRWAARPAAERHARQSRPAWCSCRRRPVRACCWSASASRRTTARATRRSLRGMYPDAGAAISAAARAVPAGEGGAQSGADAGGWHASECRRGAARFSIHSGRT